MNEIIIWSVISVTTFIVFAVLLIIGIVKKHKVLLLTATALFYIFIATMIRSGYLVIKRALKHAEFTMKPRSGDEIYTALFGKSEHPCVQMLEFQDQIIPKIDYAIWLHFTTCPEELRRILQQKTYQSAIKKGEEIVTDNPSANENWFNPQKMDKRVIVFTYNKDERGNGQTLYVSEDSTEVYCVDIMD